MTLWPQIEKEIEEGDEAHRRKCIAQIAEFEPNCIQLQELVDRMSRRWLPEHTSVSKRGKGRKGKG
jgi:hypothetical protein